MYEAFYNLQSKPFQLTPDVRLLFPSTGHRRALSYLLYGLEQREGFVVISGGVGTGKTLLIQALYKELSGRHMLTANLASANLDAPDVIPAVAAAFGLGIHGRGKVDLLDELRRDLLLSCQQGEGALLIVDEAQTLTTAALEELRVLSNMEVGGRALVQIFLVGQTELLKAARSREMEQLKQRVIAWYRLEPLSAEETRNYVMHRLRAVGWENTPGFAPEIFDLLYEWSDGIPRRVNMLMDRVMLYGFLEELHFIDRSSMQSVIDEMDNEMGFDDPEDDPNGEDPEPATPPPARTLAENVRLRPIEEQIAALDRKVNILLKNMNRRLVTGRNGRRSVVPGKASDADDQPGEQSREFQRAREGQW